MFDVTVIRPAAVATVRWTCRQCDHDHIWPPQQHLQQSSEQHASSSWHLGQYVAGLAKYDIGNPTPLENTHQQTI